MTYSPNELYNFYDKNAYIWRPSFTTTVGKNLQECSQDLAIHLEPTDTLSIASYVVNPFSNNISLSVVGYITTLKSHTAFVHDFIITQNYNKFFVVSDSFHLFVPEKLLQQTNNNVYIPNSPSQNYEFISQQEPQYQQQAPVQPIPQQEEPEIESDQEQQQQIQEQQQQIQEKQENETEKPKNQYQQNHYHSNKHYQKHYQGPSPQGYKQPQPTFHGKRQNYNSYNSKK